MLMGSFTCGLSKGCNPFQFQFHGVRFSFNDGFHGVHGRLQPKNDDDTDDDDDDGDEDDNHKSKRNP